MNELPGKLSKAIDKVLRASEGIRVDRENIGQEGVGQPDAQQHMHETMADSGAESSTSPAILKRLAEEGSGSQSYLQTQSKSGKSAKSAKSVKSAKSAKLDKDRPLSEQEKVELLYILQQSDAAYTMDEINALLDGIASGEIDKVSNKSLRKVIETAKKYGVEFVVGGLTPPSGDGAASGGRGSNNGTVPPPPWTEEPVSGGTAPGAGGVVDDVDAVQDALDETKAAIEEVRQVVQIIHQYISVFRATGNFSSESLTRFGLSKEMVLTQAVKKEAKDTEARDTKRFVEEQFREKQIEKNEAFAELALDQQWSRMVFNDPDLEGHQSSESPTSE